VRIVSVIIISWCVLILLVFGFCVEFKKKTITVCGLMFCVTKHHCRKKNLLVALIAVSASLLLQQGNQILAIDMGRV
jgi:hypothetical protein